MQRKIYGMGMLAALLTFGFVLTGCDNPAATQDTEDPSLNIAEEPTPDETVVNPVPREMVTTEGLYVGEEYLSPIALDDQTGDNVIDKALSYINAQTLTETTNYTIVLGGGSYAISGSRASRNHHGYPNITAENAVITLVGLCPAEISSSPEYRRSRLFFLSAGTLVLDNNITLQGNGDEMGGLVHLADPSIYNSNSPINAALVIKDGVKITGGGFSGVIVADGGSFVMNGGEISGNTRHEGGGVLVVEGGSFVMNGGEISGNSADWSGGGVHASSDKSSFTLRGGKISGNTADLGGGILVGSDTVFVMEGGEISGNTATSGGGVVTYAGPEYGGLFSKTGGTIYNNTLGKSRGVGKTVTFIAENADYYYDGDLGEEDNISTEDLSIWSKRALPIFQP